MSNVGRDSYEHRDTYEVTPNGDLVTEYVQKQRSDGSRYFVPVIKEKAVPVIKEKADIAKIGYHKRSIKKGVLGNLSKIEEEFEELIDAAEQNNPVMELIELTDLLGAIEAYAEKRFQVSMDQLLTMTRATQRAFKSGQRK